MSETTLQILNFTRIIWLSVFALLYGLGGISGKWKRRYLGSAWLVGGYVLYSILLGTFSYWYLLCFPLLIGALSLGYGGNTLKEKLIKRTYVGLAIALAALPIAIVTAQWGMFVYHTILITITSVSMGVFNFTGNARNEETLIACMAGIIPLFMV